MKRAAKPRRRTPVAVTQKNFRKLRRSAVACPHCEQGEVIVNYYEPVSYALLAVSPDGEPVIEADRPEPADAPVGDEDGEAARALVGFQCADCGEEVSEEDLDVDLRRTPGSDCYGARDAEPLRSQVAARRGEELQNAVRNRWKWAAQKGRALVIKTEGDHTNEKSKAEQRPKRKRRTPSGKRPGPDAA